jgi:DNA-binding MarR family transcriptional regulator
MIPDSRGQSTLISLLRRTSQLMVADLVERLAAAGYPDLPVAAHPVFENLDRDGTRLTELATRADMTHQAMGELIDTLEHRGYLERRPDPADRRARLVYLTAKGRQMTRVALREIAAIEADWARSWKGAGLRSDLRAALEHYLLQTDSSQPPRTRHRRATAKIAS